MLAIGVRPGDKIYVGAHGTYVKVLETRGFEYARIEVGSDGSCRVREWTITDQKATEILPSVLVSCGRPDVRFVEKHQKLQRAFEDAVRNGMGDKIPNPGHLLPRLIFDAPRDITILREELYRAPRKVA